MPDDFLGELPATALLDIVKPLVTRKKSGVLLVRGKEMSQLHLEGGAIIHATHGSLSGDRAITTMMDLDKGRVTFDWECSTEERSVTVPAEDVLRRWAEHEEEWKKIRQVIPSTDSVFRLPTDSADEEKTITASQWKVLARCDGARTVSDIARALEWDVFRTCTTMCRMVQSGLLERVAGAAPPSMETVNGDFFPIVERELAKAIGPIASVIVDDKIIEFGESRDAFPRDRVQAYVRAVAEEIMEDANRDEFAIGIAISLIERGYKL